MLLPAVFIGELQFEEFIQLVMEQKTDSESPEQIIESFREIAGGASTINRQQLSMVLDPEEARPRPTPRPPRPAPPCAAAVRRRNSSPVPRPFVVLPCQRSHDITYTMTTLALESRGCRSESDPLHLFWTSTSGLGQGRASFIDGVSSQVDFLLANMTSAEAGYDGPEELCPYDFDSFIDMAFGDALAEASTPRPEAAPAAHGAPAARCSLPPS